MTFILLETDRLLVRRLTLEDAPILFQYSREPITIKELPEVVLRSLEQTKKKIATILYNYEHNKYPQMFAVMLKETGEIIGHIGLSRVGLSKVEIVYAISDRFQHKGFASELVGPFTRYAKEHFHLHALYGIAKSNNTASCRCLEKAGFVLQKEGLSCCFGGLHIIRIYTA